MTFIGWSEKWLQMSDNVACNYTLLLYQQLPSKAKTNSYCSLNYYTFYFITLFPLRNASKCMSPSFSTRWFLFQAVITSIWRTLKSWLQLCPTFSKPKCSRSPPVKQIIPSPSCSAHKILFFFSVTHLTILQVFALECTVLFESHMVLKPTSCFHMETVTACASYYI